MKGADEAGVTALGQVVSITLGCWTCALTRNSCIALVTLKVRVLEDGAFAR